MFEWWQTLLLSLGIIAVGGVVTLGANLLQNRDRLRQEERNARRAYRREQIAPISKALDVVIGRRAREDTTNELKEVYYSLPEPKQTIEQYLDERLVIQRRLRNGGCGANSFYCSVNGHHT